MKTHLLDSAEPLIEGRNYFSHCLDVIPQAVFVAQSDDGASAESVIQSASCYRCKKNAKTLTRKYLYLATSGEEMKQAARGWLRFTEKCSGKGTSVQR